MRIERVLPISICLFFLVACVDKEDDISTNEKINEVNDVHIVDDISINEKANAVNDIQIEKGLLDETHWFYTENVDVRYEDVPMVKGTFYHTFTVDEEIEDFIAISVIQNKGPNTFDWKIYDQDGSIWVKGILEPGHIVTANLEKYRHLAKEEYAISFTTNNGGDASFDLGFKLSN